MPSSARHVSSEHDQWSSAHKQPQHAGGSPVELELEPELDDSPDVEPVEVEPDSVESTEVVSLVDGSAAVVDPLDSLEPPSVADSLLHAWHSSYGAILRELEERQLIGQVAAMLGELREHLAAAPGDALARADVDVYLAVALSLLHGKAMPPVASEMASMALRARFAERRFSSLSNPTV